MLSSSTSVTSNYRQSNELRLALDRLTDRQTGRNTHTHRQTYRSRVRHWNKRRLIDWYCLADCLIDRLEQPVAPVDKNRPVIWYEWTELSCCRLHADCRCPRWTLLIALLFHALYAANIVLNHQVLILPMISLCLWLIDVGRRVLQSTNAFHAGNAAAG